MNNIDSGDFNVLFESKNDTLEFSGVTVIITLYNYEHTIIETLDTVLSQTLNGLELIVVDDQSKDSGAKKVGAWMSKHRRSFWQVKLLQHVKNGGLSVARNTAFSESEGDHVFVLDADNHIFPSALKTLDEALRENEAAEFAYSMLERFGDDSSVMGTLRWSKDLLAKGNYIDAMALIRKRSWQRHGGYTVMNGIGWEDYEFWLKVADHGGFGLWVPNILGRYRVHGTSMLNSQTNTSVEQKKLKSQLLSSFDWVKL